MRKASTWTTICLAGALFAVGCESDQAGSSDANTPQRRQTQQIGQYNENSLYARMGGEHALRNVVNNYFDRSLQDPHLQVMKQASRDPGQPGAAGQTANIETMKTRYFNFLATAAGGPQEYRGEPVVQAHRELDITEEQFQASLKHWQEALDSAGIKGKERDEFLNIIRNMRQAVVDKDATSGQQNNQQQNRTENQTQTPPAEQSPPAEQNRPAEQTPPAEQNQPQSQEPQD